MPRMSYVRRTHGTDASTWGRFRTRAPRLYGLWCMEVVMMDGESGETFRTEPGFADGGPRPNENPPPASKDFGGFGFEKPYEGDTNDWLTPPKLVRMLGEFDLDPCACPRQPCALAKNSYALPEANGLTLRWEGRVFCN